MPSPAHSRHVRTGLGLLALAIVVVFGRTVAHGWVMWDDPMYILFNPVVTHWLDAPWKERLLTPGLGYPVALPVALYAAAVGALGDAASHLVHGLSIGLHVLNAALVFGLARRWLRCPAAALVGAAVWALHPLVVESVAWATNLKELLVTSAVLGGTLAWQRWLDGGRRRWLAAVGITFLVGALSKPTVIVLAPLLVAFTLLEGRDGWRARRVRLPLLAVTLACLLWYGLTKLMHDVLVGDEAAAFAMRDPLVTPLTALGLQARNYVWPVDLQPYYPLDYVTPGLNTGLGAAVALGWILALGAALWRRSPLRAPLLFGLLTYLPYSNLIPLPRVTSDTYAYLPSVGVAVALAWGWQRLLGERRLAPGLLAAAALAAVIAALSFSQAGRWATTEDLWGPLLGNPDGFALPYALVAYEDFREGRVDEAAVRLEEAWPRLRHTPELPRFAAEAFLQAGRPALAADARLQALTVYGGPVCEYVRAVDFVVENDLPLPHRPDARQTLQVALRAHSEDAEGCRRTTAEAVGAYLARQKRAATP